MSRLERATLLLCGLSACLCSPNSADTTNTRIEPASNPVWTTTSSQASSAQLTLFPGTSRILAAFVFHDQGDLDVAMECTAASGDCSDETETAGGIGYLAAFEGVAQVVPTPAITETDNETTLEVVVEDRAPGDLLVGLGASAGTALAWEDQDGQSVTPDPNLRSNRSAAYVEKVASSSEERIYLEATAAGRLLLTVLPLTPQ